MKQWILVFSMASLLGCATAPVSQGVAKQAPANRVFAYQKPTTAEDGNLVLIRDSGALGSGCRVLIYVDDIQAASLSSSEKVSLYIPPGQHIVASGPTGNGLCGMGNGKEAIKRSFTITIEAQHTTVYRIAIGFGSDGAILMPVSL